MIFLLQKGGGQCPCSNQEQAEEWVPMWPGGSPILWGTGRWGWAASSGYPGHYHEVWHSMSTLRSSTIQDWNRHTVTSDCTLKLLREEEGRVSGVMPCPAWHWFLFNKSGPVLQCEIHTALQVCLGTHSYVHSLIHLPS